MDLTKPQGINTSFHLVECRPWNWLLRRRRGLDPMHIRRLSKRPGHADMVSCKPYFSKALAS